MTTKLTTEDVPQPMVPPQSPTGQDANKRTILMVFAGLIVSMLLSALDQTVFSTALPTIVGELDGVNHMLWVTTGYLVAVTIMMPIYGKLGDMMGRKTLFLGALTVFLIGSVIGGFATNMTWLIIARVVQGLGGGGLMILSQAIIADIVPVRDRGKYMGCDGGSVRPVQCGRPRAGWLVRREHRVALGVLDEPAHRDNRHYHCGHRVEAAQA